MDMKLPFSTTGMMLHIDDSMDYEVLSSSIESMPKSDKTEDEIVLEAMAHPIGSPKLSELAKGKENVVIICSDHTRPVPSKHIIPFMLKEIREGNPDAKITLLIATGFHRATTRSAVNTISSRIFLIDKLLKSNIFLLLLPYMYFLNFSG